MGLSFSALVSASLRKTLEERTVEISALLPEITLNSAIDICDIGTHSGLY